MQPRKHEMTFNDLLEKLRLEEETTLIDLLELNSFELVDLLEAVIHDKQDKVRHYYDENDEAVDG